MKRIYYSVVTSLAALAFVSCASDDMSTATGVRESMQKSEAALISGDQSRVVLPSTGTTSSKAKVSSRAGETEPTIPAGATEITDEGGWGTMWTFDNPDNNYYLPADKTLKLTAFSGADNKTLNVYVAGDFTLENVWGNNVTINIYVLSGGSFTGCAPAYDNLAHISKGWSIDVWGTYNVPSQFHGIALSDGGSLVYHAGANGGKAVIGDGTLDPNSFVSLSVGQGCTLTADVPVEVNGSAWFNGGVSTFNEGIVVDQNLVSKSGDLDPVVNMYKCSKILGQWVGESNSAGTFNVYDYLYCGSLHDNAANVYVHLYDALVDVDNVFSTINVDDYKINRLVDKFGSGYRFIGEAGSYNSVVRYLNNDLSIDKGNDYEVVPGEGTPTSFVNKISFTGHITLLSEKVTAQYEQITGLNDVTDIITFEDGNVAFNDASTYLPTNAEGCRPEVGKKPVVTVTVPAHKYSATAIAFGNDGKMYLSWHSNSGANGVGGTNMKSITNLDGSSVSVDDLNDWGGIVDVLDASNAASPSLAQSLIQTEHKYNHVCYDNNTLYLAGTSNKVGAALHEVELQSDGTIDATTFDSKNTRVNLTGSSANCALVNNGQVITISGYNNGGINKFATNDYSNQEKKAVVEESNFQGKYVYNDGTNIITLNNTTDGTVTIYTQDMDKVSSFNVGSIRPTDGKNVCVGDGQYIYVCQGANGFSIYDYSGNRVGGSKKSANGVDFDSNFVYVATGKGLVVLSKKNTYVDENDGKTYNKTVKRFTYTGTGNARYDETIAKSEDASTEKQSSNFVKVKNGKAYVAYGMYGLQVYDIADITE